MPQIFLPNDGLLRHGPIVRDRAARLDSSVVTLGSGERLAADDVVLASGSAYPFPAKSDLDVAAVAQAKYLAANENLRPAFRKEIGRQARDLGADCCRKARVANGVICHRTLVVSALVALR